MIDAQLTTIQIYLRPLMRFREISEEVNSRERLFLDVWVVAVPI